MGESSQAVFMAWIAADAVKVWNRGVFRAGVKRSTMFPNAVLYKNRIILGDEWAYERDEALAKAAALIDREIASYQRRIEELAEKKERLDALK